MRLPARPLSRTTRRRARGFTLIEVLVALSVMALLAMLSWRSVDGMSRTQSLTRERTDQVLRMQSAIGQWLADLDAIMDTQEITPLAFDGRLLRLTRRDAAESGLHSAGVRVVAWTLRDGQWMRWQSGHLLYRDDLARAWDRAAVWSQGLGGNLQASPVGDSAVALAAVDQWQIFYHRGETWGNPLSSAGTDASTAAQAGLPNGVRLVLTLAGGHPISGQLTRDWVRPTLEASQ